MKQFTWTVFFICTVFGLCAQESLVFTGNITEKATDLPLKKVQIKVTDQNKRSVTKTKTDAAGNYTFSLSTGQSAVYTVKVSRGGYVIKYFTISTEAIPDNQRGTKFPKITADLRLFKPVKGIDYSALQQPLNRYYYDPAKDNYAYDKALLEKSIKMLLELEEREKAQKEIK